MRTGLALMLALALGFLVQQCGGGTANNSNTTPVSNGSANSTPGANINMNIDMNSNTKSAVGNSNERSSPSPSPAQSDEQPKSNSNSNTPPANQRKIPHYGELGNDAPPARNPTRTPEHKSSPR